MYVCMCVYIYTYIKCYLFIRWAGSSLLHQPFFSCGEQGLLSSCSAQFLFLAASLVGDHRLQSSWTPAVEERGLSSCDAWA